MDNLNMIVHITILFFLFYCSYYVIKTKKELKLAKDILSSDQKKIKIIKADVFFKNICELTDVSYAQSGLFPKNFYIKIKSHSFIKFITIQPINKVYLKYYLNDMNHGTIELEITAASAVINKEKQEEILSKDLTFKTIITQN